MKILVIFTGGTIGSAVGDNSVIALDSAKKYLLLERYAEKYGAEDTEFDTISPYSTLSEHLSAKELTELTKCVGKNIQSCYDGIIITHGTDTIQYSSAALAYSLGSDTVPVMLVSSNRPIDVNGANGLDNFAAAVSFIKAGAGRGVFVPYKNRGEDFVRINRAVKLIAYRELDDRLYCVDDEICAGAYGDRIDVTYEPPRRGGGLGPIRFIERPRILTVSARPGDGFYYDLDNYEAVLLSPYHSSTLNTESREFCEFCAAAAEKNIPVFAVNIGSGAVYESALLYNELGIVKLYNSAFAAAYIKLWIALSRGENIREFMKKPICGEFE